MRSGRDRVHAPVSVLLKGEWGNDDEYDDEKEEPGEPGGEVDYISDLSGVRWRKNRNRHQVLSF